MTLEGARQMMKRDKGNDSASKQIEVIDRLKAIRDELQAINKEFSSLV